MIERLEDLILPSGGNPLTATNMTQTQSYAEGDASVALTAIVVSDPEAWDSITTMLTVADPGKGGLSAGSGHGESYNPTTGVWTVIGGLTVVNAALAATAFLPATDNDQTTTINVHMQDALATGPSDGTITLNVTAVNDAPVLAGANDFTGITEDNAANSGEQVCALGNISDPDTGAVQGIALTSTVSGPGWWEYSRNSGTTWNAVGTVSTSAALLLTSTDRVRFVPDGANGATAAVTFLAWDRTTGTAGSIADASTTGGSTAFSTADATATIAVSDVNDAPVLAGARNLTAISQYNTTNGGDLVGTLVNGHVTDVDSGAGHGIALTSVVSVLGTWEYSTDNGTSWTAVGAVSTTSALLLAGSDVIRFVPSGANGTNSTISFLAWDQTTGTPGTLVNASSTGGTTAFSGASATSSITVTNVQANFVWGIASNAPPVFGSQGDQAKAEGDVISLQLSASDPELHALTFAAIGLPKGLAMDGAGLVSGAIDYAAAELFGGTYETQVVAVDGQGGAASLSFFWTITNKNRAPVVTAVVDQAAQAGAAVSLQLNASDPDADGLFYSATGLPPGVFMAPMTGLISGVVDSDADTESRTVTATVTDADLATTCTFLWNVTGNAKPIVSQLADQSNSEGTYVAQQVAATDPLNGSLTYSADHLPPGLSIDGNGLISGTIGPGAANFPDHFVTITVANALTSVSMDFKWTTAAYVTVNAIADQTCAEGSYLAYQVNASVPSGTLTYSADGLPDGLAIDGAGLIAGTVATGISKYGPYQVSVTASDGTYSTTREFSWAVTRVGNSAPVLSSPGTQTGTTGDAVSLTLVVSDTDDDALTYSATGLPAGIEIDAATGEMSGTLADDAVQPLPHNVTVTVTDGHGGTGSVSFDWVVGDAVLSLQGSAVTGVEGTLLDEVAVATFTDARLGRPQAWYQATIQWGDATNSGGIVVESETTPGSFTVYGSHAYVHPGSYAISVDVANPVNTSVSTTCSASIGVASLSLTGGMTVFAVAGQTANWDLGVLVDGNSLRLQSSYSVAIDWGDGTGSGALVGGLGVFLARGSHQYLANGDYSVTVTVTDGDGRSTSAGSFAQVGNYQAGEEATLSVGGFVIADPVSSVSAAIDWGDGVVDSVGMDSSFLVKGSHRYAAAGVYEVRVAVTSPSDGTQVDVDTIRVVNASLTKIANPFEVAASNSERVVAAFATGNIAEAAGDFAALIDWGDGTSSPAAHIDQVAPGLFQVFAIHAFAAVPANAPVLELLRVGQLVAAQAGVPLLGRFVIPPKARNLARVLEADFLVWADGVMPGTGTRYLTLAKVNTLIDDFRVKMWDAVAAATLKTFVLQNPNNLLRVGEEADLFGMSGLQYLTLANIQRFASVLATPGSPLYGRAVRLDAFYDRELILLSHKRQELFAGRDELWQTVKQGRIGDCAFMAAAIGLAKAIGRAGIDNRIVRQAALAANGAQQFIVTVFNLQGNQIVQTNVSVEEPTDADRVLYGNATNEVLWLPVLEKAYVTTWPRIGNVYSRISTSLYDVAADGERADTAVVRVTGQRARFRVPGGLPVLDAFNVGLINFYLNAVNRGKVVVVGSKDVLPQAAVNFGLPPGHGFTVVGFEKISGSWLITLRNPWNDPNRPLNDPYRACAQTVKLSIQQLKDWFGSITAQGTFFNF